MRCLVPLSACIIGPLALTAGLVAGTLACLALGTHDWPAAGNGRRSTPQGEDSAGRVGGIAGATEPAARPRHRRGR
jgi:hypothetical protein